MTTALELAQRWAEAPRILIVDDDENAASAVKSMLGRYDCEVEVVGTMWKALKLVNECHFDLVFVDPVLPDGDGICVIKQIKVLSPSTPIVVMAGTLGGPVVESAFSCGIVSLLRKPYDMTWPHLRDVLNMFKIRTRQMRPLSTSATT